MSTNTTRPQKDTDCIALTDTELAALRQRARETISDGCLIGIDSARNVHYFSRSTRQVAVFDGAGDTDPTVIDMLDAPIPDTPRAWARHVVRQQGDRWADLRLTLDAQRALEADR